LTDGVLEIDERPYEDDQRLYEAFKDENKLAIKNILFTVKEKLGRDNATIIAWDVKTKEDGLRPTR